MLPRPGLPILKRRPIGLRRTCKFSSNNQPNKEQGSLTSFPASSLSNAFMMAALDQRLKSPQQEGNSVAPGSATVAAYKPARRRRSQGRVPVSHRAECSRADRSWLAFHYSLPLLACRMKYFFADHDNGSPGYAELRIAAFFQLSRIFQKNRFVLFSHQITQVLVSMKKVTPPLRFWAKYLSKFLL
jgi:hypothetical protein